MKADTHPDDDRICTKCDEFCCTCELCDCCCKRLTDADKLRALITAWADAEEPLTIARGGFTEELNAHEAARDALLKEVGR